MALKVVENTYIVESYRDFCSIIGEEYDEDIDYGFDDECIENHLEKRDGEFLLHFVDDKYDGYFIIFCLEGDLK